MSYNERREKKRERERERERERNEPECRERLGGETGVNILFQSSTDSKPRSDVQILFSLPSLSSSFLCFVPLFNTTTTVMHRLKSCAAPLTASLRIQVQTMACKSVASRTAEVISSHLIPFAYLILSSPVSFYPAFLFHFIILSCMFFLLSFCCIAMFRTSSLTPWASSIARTSRRAGSAN